MEASTQSEPAEVLFATPEHLEGIAAIYDAAVLEGPATFDIAPRGVTPWSQALEAAPDHDGHKLLVAVDRSQAVLGFARSGPFMERPAYSTTCLTSVYVAEGARRRGIATLLYAELFARIENSSLRLAVAGITEPNPASTALHQSFGFERVGTFSGVGVKFGREWDVTWYERPLTPSPADGRRSRPP